MHHQNNYSVKLKTIADEHGLTPLHLSKDYETAMLTTSDVNRPAMQLTGFYNYFDPNRLQIMGRVESTYLDTLSSGQRLETFERFMQYDIVGLVICHNVPAFPECIDMACKYDRNVFITTEDTSEFQADIITSLRKYLAPRLTTHGVLVEVYGEGLLLIGDSGIGKSETALELIKRGHRLIADDAVEVKRISRDALIGTAPELIRYYMELRGIGVINVRHLYGMGAVKPESNIDLVVKMEPWEEGKAYDRLGLENETASFLGVNLPQVTIPVRPGRNLAVIMELAAMNNRQKKMGYNAAEALAAEHDMAIDRGLI
ncbi:MAG: HPr(Ser) kinase/phosphatase [Clostridiales bacterium]|nr:HPr(Ser) kinase/phosphatase [Clostridiales bacterium]